MIKSKAPQRLWDDCLEFESAICINTTHGMHKHYGKVSRTVMTEEVSKICHFCELKWYEWVMFWDEIAPYLDDRFKLGKYLGPCMDIGQAMMARILPQTVRSCISPYTICSHKKIGAARR